MYLLPPAYIATGKSKARRPDLQKPFKRVQTRVEPRPCLKSGLISANTVRGTKAYIVLTFLSLIGPFNNTASQNPFGQLNSFTAASGRSFRTGTSRSSRDSFLKAYVSCTPHCATMQFMSWIRQDPAVTVNLTFVYKKCRSVSGKTLESKTSPGASCPAPWDGWRCMSQNPTSKRRKCTRDAVIWRTRFKMLLVLSLCGLLPCGVPTQGCHKALPDHAFNTTAEDSPVRLGTDAHQRISRDPQVDPAK